MDDAGLVEAAHANFVAAIAMIAERRPDGFVQRRNGLAILVSRLPIRLFNQVFVEAWDARPTDLAEAVATTRSLGVDFVVHLRLDHDDHLAETLTQLGLKAARDDQLLPAMAVAPIATAPAAPTALEVHQVDDEKAFADFLAAAAAGFEMGPTLVADLFSLDMLDEPGLSFHVGYLDGRPVSTSMGYRSGAVIGVYTVATIPSARRRGYGAAMTSVVLREGAAAGCAVGILQSSTMGYPVYESLGFRTVLRYRGYSGGPAT
jgi:GNAT superfamily N-acetyltransferase